MRLHESFWAHLITHSGRRAFNRPERASEKESLLAMAFDLAAPGHETRRAAIRCWRIVLHGAPDASFGSLICETRRRCAHNESARFGFLFSYASSSALVNLPIIRFALSYRSSVCRENTASDECLVAFSLC